MKIPYSHASEENTLHLLHDYLTLTLTTPYPSSDPIRLIVGDGDGNDDDGRLGSNSNGNSNSGSNGSSSGYCPTTAINPTMLSARPHDILRLARDKLHTWPYQDVPVCWRRVVIESVLWCCVGLLEDQKDKVRIKIESKGEERINTEEEEEEEISQDWVAEFVRVLDEGVIVSGAPGREEVVEKVLEILDEWLLRRSGWTRKRKRKRVIDWVGMRQLRQLQQQQEEKKGREGKDGGKEEEEEEEEDENDMNVEKERRRKKKKKDSRSTNGNGNSLSDDYFYPPHINPLPPRFSACTPSSSAPLASIPIDCPIQRCERPSLAAFESHLRGMKGILKTDQTVDRWFCAVDGHKDVDFPTPLVLKSCITHWPAICDPTRSWDSPRYLLSRALGGRRLVPVEIGRSYVDDGWGQKIVPFGEFMEMLLDDDDVDVDDFNGQLDGRREKQRFDKFNIDGDMNDKESKSRASRNTRGNLRKDSKQKASEEVKRKRRTKRQKWYLAQHDLFTQMPALRADIAIPEYCYLSSIPTPPSSPEVSQTSESRKPSPSPPPPPQQIYLNAWLGPAGTISPLHTDPHHNILAQVVGRKYVRLYAPSHTEKVYPRGVDSNGVGSSNSKRERTKEHGDMCNADGDQYGGDDDDNDDDNNDNGKATTPHQSANTSHVDVGNVLAWAWAWEDGDGSSSNDDNNDDDDDVKYNPPDQSLPRQQQQQQQQQQHHHHQKQQYQKALQTIRTKYPLFLDAPYLETVLEPGECLFIPRSWWHYVRSLSPSFSVSFWWD